MLMTPRLLHSSSAACLALVLLLAVFRSAACQTTGEDSVTDRVPEPTDASALVEQVARLLQDNYLDVSVADECIQRIRSQLADGAYRGADTREVLAAAITSDLQDVSHDLHMRVEVPPEVSTPTSAEGEPDEEAADTHPLLEALEVYEFEKRGNFGVIAVKWLSGNVGYVDLRAFLDIARVRPKIESAMMLLSDMDAVIIDLRSLVRGGYPETVGFIAGYFFSEPTLLQRIVFPRTGSVDETWALGPTGGPDLSDVPLFILTSERVFSAGEAFTYGMQSQGRATVVGTTTKGGAHLTRPFRVDPGFDVYVPIGRSVNPATGANWEGTGVVPDIATEADDALDVALPLAQEAAEARKEARESEDRSLALDVEARLLEALSECGEGASEQSAGKVRDALAQGLEGKVLTEDMINDVGYYCLEQGLVDAAIEVFQFNVARFPDSANAHDSLGEALLAAGRPAEAEASYRRALELNPWLASSRAAIDKLKGGQ
jgi:hypothetical protein